MDKYLDILLYSVGGLLFIVGGLFTSYLIRPNRPNEEKLTTYESGEAPLGESRALINVRFYVIAIIFLLFELEIIFLFPWAVVFGDAEMASQSENMWGWYALAEMFIFIAVLTLGLAYVWRMGYLEWPKPQSQPENYQSPVPKSMYEAFNKKY